MTQKEKLVELINEADSNYNFELSVGKIPKPRVEYEAEFLLKNGVIVPPCKVGDTVWVIRSQTSNGKNLYILEDRVKRIVMERQECLQPAWTRIEFENITSEFEWGFSNIFLTKEQAEKVLAEKRADNG